MEDTVTIILSAFAALAVNFIFSGVVKQLTNALSPGSTTVEIILFLIINILMTVTAFHISFTHIKRHSNGS